MTEIKAGIVDGNIVPLDEDAARWYVEQGNFPPLNEKNTGTYAALKEVFDSFSEDFIHSLFTEDCTWRNAIVLWRKINPRSIDGVINSLQYKDNSPLGRRREAYRNAESIEESLRRLGFNTKKVSATLSSDMCVHSPHCDSRISCLGYDTNVCSSGRNSYVSALGRSSKIVSTGAATYAVAVNDYSSVDIHGTKSLGAALSPHGKVRGVMGSWLILGDGDWDNYLGTWVPTGIHVIHIDGENYKPDTWYTVEGGIVVETNHNGESDSLACNQS